MPAEDAGEAGGALGVVMLGPPGAGKGTQAERIGRAYGIPHVATGNIFRANVKGGTELGRRAHGFMQEGELVPDEVVVEMVRERLRETDAAAGFVLDGFPRNVTQAEALDDLLDEIGRPLDVVLHFAIDAEEVVRRITGRRVCTDCGATYHVEFNPPPQVGACPCGGELIQRHDDTEDVVRHRLEVYRRETGPLEDFYRRRGLLRDVDAVGSVDEVTARALDVLAAHAEPGDGVRG